MASGTSFWHIPKQSVSAVFGIVELIAIECFDGMEKNGQD
jgi:hypothetical protein